MLICCKPELKEEKRGQSDRFALELKEEKRSFSQKFLSTFFKKSNPANKRKKSSTTTAKKNWLWRRAKTIRGGRPLNETIISGQNGRSA